uniref:NADH dehydrogenase [ubiquinone] 1 alpha subcomplex assembly factor 3 n=1 Tax=Pseudictyota dubia TaxID=2749911 RepID=A0A7R9WDE9_9STRA|mmetsp:Transcript_45485/g.84276  ORF Transcript_45485/g.84276 Transcript_45485/m.84276 type:complete len:224 (+) Transcript_45485:66-737(+)|eukprot:CAMPEP_0197450356 /NCGR_PEP_ID=MMETSP1175-20131217/25000_1 /TAXON_ID=1003142 /ORGANISM="Triceratium dubium, Strain CCMP147" /LENGTH=223 /DNA_ID=CAMNT_0042982759 /DNA_START=66 /DNA_END=737 /DNA_ORIENTATION=+
MPRYALSSLQKHRILLDRWIPHILPSPKLISRRCDYFAPFRAICPLGSSLVPRIQTGRCFSGIRGGTDLLEDSLAFGDRRKIILDSYYPTGFDVIGMLEKPTAGASLAGEDEEDRVKSDTLHMNGSIIAFPHSCFLWKVSEPKDVTVDTLSLVVLHKPAVEFLFIGSNKPLPPRELNKIKKDFKPRGIIVEQLDLTNAMGTFNILNGEDRRVAVALIIDPNMG